MSETGLVSRVLPVHTAVRNCTRDEGGPFEVGDQVLTLKGRYTRCTCAMEVRGARSLAASLDAISNAVCASCDERVNDEI
jgi:hypothetical protein